jgi:transposase-like protein
MRQKSNSTPASSETLVRNIRRATRRHHAAEEKIRIELDGLRGETSIVEVCRREGIAESMYYSWSKEFLEAGKRRLAGDTAQQPFFQSDRSCAFSWSDSANGKPVKE